MITDELGVALHDRATRGLPLSGAEQAQLQAWYEEKDREEAAVFAQAAQRRQAALQAEIAQAEAYLAKVTENNRVIEMQNAALRAELEALRTRLAARAAQQALTNQATLNQQVR